MLLLQALQPSTQRRRSCRGRALLEETWCRRRSVAGLLGRGERCRRLRGWKERNLGWWKEWRRQRIRW